MKELIFSYNHERCHAVIVESLPDNTRYIGEMDGYEIYQIKTVWFDQFGFMAIRRDNGK